MGRQQRRIFRGFLYAVLIAAIAVQAGRTVLSIVAPGGANSIPKMVVTVAGNVERPGRYRVPEGTTNFEILKVAGVRMTSDLSGLTLGQEAQANQTLAVGTRTQEVSLRPQARLEFLLGNVSILSVDGKEKPVQVGVELDVGDQVQTDPGGQAELSLNAYSRVDMDKEAEIVLDKIGEKEAEATVVELYQKTGVCWYKMAYAQKDEVFRVTTPLVTLSVAGKGADFTVDASFTNVVVENRDGLVLVERASGGEAVNLISGQRVTIYNDGRPFEVGALVPGAGVTERFTSLTKVKTDQAVRALPFTVLLCALPGVFHLVSVQYDAAVVRAVTIPAQLSVADYAEGFSTMQEAYLYGGSTYASALVERILNVRVPKYAVLEKENVVRAASVLGGVNVTLDDATASLLKMKGGKRKMNDKDLVEFLRPGSEGSAESERRQMLVIRSIFDAFRSHSVMLTALQADQVLSGMQSNLSSTEVMQQYARFIGTPNWQFDTRTLPTRSSTMGGRAVLLPETDACRNLFSQK